MKISTEIASAARICGEHKAHVDIVNDPCMVACLDIGHAQMRGCNTNAPEMILALGERLQALHIHDNDCWHDNHQIPFSMNIDFDAVVDALKKIGKNDGVIAC